MDARLLWISLCSGLGLAVAAGCYSGSAVDTNRPPAASTSPTEPPKMNMNDKTTGLPCEISKIVLSSCDDCHGSMLDDGVDAHLLTYDDFMARHDEHPDKTIAEVALERMRATDKPMPPDKRLDESDIETFEKWVKAGMPRGTCGDESSDDSDAGTDGGDDPGEPDAASVCTSGTTYNAKVDNNSSLMSPGTTCVSCHAEKKATKLFAAGTVYGSLHEPDNCNGTQGSNLSVILIGADGVSHTVPVNEAGNFVRYTSIPVPYRAMVVRGTDVREMKASVIDGDCNRCHTEWGDGSPGRVMAP
jgi:mono/diheme cytochrome c family protein